MTDLLYENKKEYLKNKNIKIYCVHPGWAQTPGLEPLFD
jgi:hypothetical protein